MILFFTDQSEFRQWLAENHETATELIVGFYKKGSGKPSMTWSESVDQALCFGWIDGVRRSRDGESYVIRFTPRKSTSRWSAVNIEKIKQLTEQGLMHPAGIKAFESRRDRETDGYRYSEFSAELSAEMIGIFDRSTAAREFFEAQPPGYKRIAIYWIMSAKQEKTRLSRLAKLIAASEKGERI